MTGLRLIAAMGCFFLILALGCHSTPLRAPAATVTNLEQETNWLKDYKWARAHQNDESEKSCTLFRTLAGDAKFPGHDLALLRSVETCPAESIKDFERGKLPSWLQEQAIAVMLKLAAGHNDKVAEMDLALEKSKQRLAQSEKVKWMNLAIQRAEELDLPDKPEEFKQRLYSIAPRLNPAPLEKQFLATASDWRLARQFDKARELYEKVLKSKIYDTDDKIAALKGIRLSYKNARQNESHLVAAQRLVDFLERQCKANPRSRALLVASYDAQVYRARALWTLGQTTETKKIMDRLERKMKGKISLAELYWLRGRLAEESQDFATVSHFMDLALKERFNDGDLHDKIMWYSAWNERRRGNKTRAIELLTDLDKNTQTDFTRQRALFWLGKSYLDNQQEEEAKATFNRLIEMDPLGFYGLLAHRQLKMPITLQASSPEPSGEIQVPLDAGIAEWLYLLDEKEALTSLLDQASQNYKKQKDQNDDGWVVIFKYYAKAGLYMKLYESLGNLTPDRRKSIFESHPELLFPQPWNEEVRGASVQFGVDEELIYAITRQESAFDPHARSLADAFGLMQLLPEVAEQLSVKYKIPYTGMEDLYEPKTNIYFGAAHLKELFMRHHDQFILAVASYNASENVIRAWMKSRFHGDSLEFIEEIPYEETRSYVRLVMRNLIFYSLLKSKSASIDFPDRVLKLESL